MSSITPQGSVPDPARGVRPLPPRPNLELERKHAKKLLGKLRRGDPGALERVRDHLPSHIDSFKLTDAQFAIAREYGFRSWPRLVEYFTTLDRHVRTPWPRQQRTREDHEGRAQSRFIEFRQGHAGVGMAFATFVPRLFGSTLEEVFASAVTLDDARLVVAREFRFPSWDALLDDSARPRYAPLPADSPFSMANAAMRRNDVAALEQILETNPEIVGSGSPEESDEYSLIRAALWRERKERSPEARRMTDYLIARGADHVRSLNIMLLSTFQANIAEVAFLLERGADPAYIAPNGIPLLEYALCRFWNGEAVDLVARRVVPRKMFWIAAGLGDVEALATYVDRQCVPSEAARRHRPDFTAVGPGVVPSLPNASDAEIVWEAFLVAAFNGRFAVLDALLQRGFPIDYSFCEMTLAHFAVGNRMIPLAEYLVSRGANLDIRGWRPAMTAREMASEDYQEQPDNPASRRIFDVTR